MRLLRLFAGSVLLGLLLGCDETTPTELTVGTTDGSPEFRRSSGGSRLSSTFYRGTDGWTMVGDAVGATIASGSLDLQPRFSSTDGNPGGAIFAIDEGKHLTFYFQAPPRFLGNQLGSYGGSLEFDVKFSGPGTIVSFADVILAGGGITLVIDAGPEPTTEWTSYSIRLDESAGWRISNPSTGAVASRADMRKVLRDLSVLRIRGEYTNAIDTGYLDNVRIKRGRRW